MAGYPTSQPAASSLRNSKTNQTGERKDVQVVKNAFMAAAEVIVGYYKNKIWGKLNRYLQ